VAVTTRVADGIGLAVGKAREAIASADALLIAAGAGMGVDSGLPDFRGPDGFWRAYPVAKLLGLRFEELANPRWFERDPQLAWGFYGHRRNLYRTTRPHEGFEILLNWARQKEFFVFTSNVDGHFQAAGFAEDRIVECHGSASFLQCTQPCCNEIWANAHQLTIEEAALKCALPLPKCPRCGAIARPNVLMFNDSRFLYDRHDEQADRFARFLRDLEGKRVAIIECGAGTAVPTVRMMCERVAAASDRATLIRINPCQATVPAGQVSLAMGALEALRLLESGVI
jgi:NAD-dependent SIR2 family protein deacetylase